MKPESDRPLRLCFVSADYPTLARGGIGGIGAHTYALAHAVAGLGHRVSVIAEAINGTTAPPDGLVDLRPVSRGSRRQWKLGRWLPVPWLRWSFAARRELERLHRQDPLDLVVFPDAYGEGFRYSLSPFLPYVVRFGGPASVYQRWDGRPVPPTRARIETMVERVPAERATLLACASRAFSDLIAQEWNLDRSRFRLIRNPLNVERFRPAEPGFARAPSSVLFVGHLQPLKGVHELMAAVPIVCRRHPDAVFTLMANDTRTGPGRTSLQRFLEQGLREQGLLERVRFLPPVPQQELVPHYQATSVFVHPAQNDVYPNALLEAMGCARPCVVTSTIGNAELVAESGCGIVVPPRDAEALGAAISDILSLSDGERDAMGARGRRMVETMCATPVIAARAVEVYREAIDRFHGEATSRPAPR